MNATAICHAPLLDRRNTVMRESITAESIHEPLEFHDAWHCSECKREFPSLGSTERHIEFEHAS